MNSTQPPSFGDMSTPLPRLGPPDTQGTPDGSATPGAAASNTGAGVEPPQARAGGESPAGDQAAEQAQPRRAQRSVSTDQPAPSQAPASRRYTEAATKGAVQGAMTTGEVTGAVAGAAKGVGEQAVRDAVQDLSSPEDSKVVRGAAMTGVASQAPLVGMAAWMASFIAWLKSLMFGLAAAVMNMATMLWGMAVAVLKAVGTALLAPFATVGSAIAGVVSSIFGITSAVVAPVASVVSLVGLVAGLFVVVQQSDAEMVRRSDDLVVNEVECVAAVASATGGQVAASAEAQAKAAWLVMRGWGMPRTNIAGVLGNFSRESGIDPTSVEGIYDEPYRIGPRKKAAQKAGFNHISGVSRAGIGVAQWTNGRNQLLLDYAETKGQNWYEMSTQMAFMREGDNAGDRAVVQHLIDNEMDSPAKAADYFHDKWERSDDTASMQAARGEQAEMWFGRMAAWEANPGSSITVPVSDTDDPETDSGTTTTVEDGAAPLRIATANIPMRVGWNGLTSSLRTVTPGMDIVALQEIKGYTPRQLESVIEGWKVHQGQNSVQPLRSNAVMWRADEFEKVKAGSQIMVPQDANYYRGRVRSWPRGVTWVQLRRKSDGTVFTMISTHFPVNPSKYGPDKPLRQQRYGQGMDNLLDLVSVLGAQGPVFVAGDMNTHTWTQGSWTAASKMREAGFTWANHSVDYVFGPSGAKLLTQSTGKMVSDHQWVRATYAIAGMTTSQMLAGLSGVADTLASEDVCPAGMDVMDTSFSGTLTDGGLSEADAQALIELYNKEGDAFLDQRYGPNGGPGTCGSNHAMNCVSFSTYFVNKYTSFQGYAPGDGRDTAKTLASMTNRTTSATPTAYSIFSYATATYGHTGVVLAVRGDQILIGEASYCTHMGRLRWVEASTWRGWEFTDVSDLTRAGALGSQA